MPVCKQQGLELGSEGLADLGLAVRDRVTGTTTTEKSEGSSGGADGDPLFSYFIPFTSPGYCSTPVSLIPYHAPIFLSQLKSLQKPYKLPTLPSEKLTASYKSWMGPCTWFSRSPKLEGTRPTGRLGLFDLWIGLELRFSVKLRSILWLRLAVVAAYRLLSADMLIATIAPMK